MKNLKKEDKLYIQTFREIRSYIIRNGLKAGDSLPTEIAMCQMLGISRNVLREAMKSMELMGMIQACPGRGTIVKEFNLDFIFQNVLFFTVGEEEEKSIKEMFGIRKMLELSYMRQAYLALTDDDIRQMRICMQNIQKKWDEHKLFHAEDKAFHMTLFKSLSNGVLTSLMEAIWAVDDGFQIEEKEKHMDSTIAKHEAIVIALEARDYEAFAKAMENHFASGKYLNNNTYEEY